MVAVAVQFAVNGAFLASFVPRLPELRDELDISTGAIGVMLTVASATGLLASMSVRAVIARFGTRRVLLAGGLLVSAFLAVLGVAGAWPLAIVGLGGMFFFDVYVDVAMNMQGSWLSARRHHPVMNRLHGAWSLGCVLGGVAAGALADSEVSIRAHLTVTAAVLAVLSTGVAFLLLPTDEVHADERLSAPVAEATAPRSHSSRFFLAGMTAVVLESVAISWAAFRITDDLDGSTAMSAWAYVAVVGGMAIGRFAGDHLSHWFGSDPLMRSSAVLATIGLVIAAFIPVELLTVVAFLLAGLGIATLMPRLYDLAARAGGGSASGLGVLTAGIRTAALVAPLGIAAIASAGTVGLAIAVSAVLAGPGFLIATRTDG